ncbi:MAG: hypothetical protein WCK99_13315 [Mycobacteriaceae bacterium]
MTVHLSFVETPTMCPICWATLLATFALAIGTSAVVIAGRDRITLLIAMPLLVAAAVQRAGIVDVAGDVFAAVIAMIVTRVVWVVAQYREHLQLDEAWRRAVWIAHASCPKRRRAAGASLGARMAERSDFGPPQSTEGHAHG